MANYFMQGGDGKEYGPVSAEQLRQWLAEGRANAQTQVRLAEGGSYQAFGTVAELIAVAPTAASYVTTASAPLAQTLAQNSALAGTDSTMQVKRLATVLAAGSGWMKFFAILMFISSVFLVFSIWGTLIFWMPIWLGVVAWSAASKAEQAVMTGTEADLAQALDRLRFTFKLYAIMLVAAFLIGVVCFVLFMSVMGGLANMGNLGNLGNMGIH